VNRNVEGEFARVKRREVLKRLTIATGGTLLPNWFAQQQNALAVSLPAVEIGWCREGALL
jgi:hypothetical protein